MGSAINKTIEKLMKTKISISSMIDIPIIEEKIVELSTFFIKFAEFFFR